MKAFCIKMLTFFSLLTSNLSAQSQPGKTEELRNKQAVITAFNNWAAGTGSFFDLLTDDVTWTISGSSPHSRTYYSKQELMDEVIMPLNRRLSEKIVPAVRNVYADGNTVIVIWDGKAKATDGRPYLVSYAWFLEMKDGRIFRVTAFLDTIDFADIMQRIKA
jgi:uncharacterized protein